MRYNFSFLVFTFIIAFIQAPKPENIQIFNIGNYYSKEGFYEITVLKNEIFGFQFGKSRGTPCMWEHLNDSFLKESNYVRFLNSTTWDFLSEEYEKELKEAKNSNRSYKPLHILGGSESYYELFKALDGGNQPQTLNFIYTCGDDTIYENASVYIWICDEIYKDQCINNQNTKCVYNKENKKCISKTLCDKIENVSKSSCENAVTSTPSLTKCYYEKSEEGANTQGKCVIRKLCVNSLTEEECSSAETKNPKTSKCVFDKIQNICKEEKKFCYEIEDGATEDICSSAKVSEANKACILDNETNFCNEVYIMKDDAGNNRKNILLYFILYLLLFI